MEGNRRNCHVLGGLSATLTLGLFQGCPSLRNNCQGVRNGRIRVFADYESRCQRSISDLTFGLLQLPVVFRWVVIYNCHPETFAAAVAFLAMRRKPLAPASFARASRCGRPVEALPDCISISPIAKRASNS